MFRENHVGRLSVGIFSAKQTCNWTVRWTDHDKPYCICLDKMVLLFVVGTISWIVQKECLWKLFPSSTAFIYIIIIYWAPKETIHSYLKLCYSKHWHPLSVMQFLMYSHNTPWKILFLYELFIFSASLSFLITYYLINIKNKKCLLRSDVLTRVKPPCIHPAIDSIIIIKTPSLICNRSHKDIAYLADKTVKGNLPWEYKLVFATICMLIMVTPLN